MDLVPALLQAMVSVDGEALVMHTGEKPYVVGPAGQVALSSGVLTRQAVGQVVGALLPAEFQQSLEESGVAQYSLPPHADFPHEQFTVMAARGNDDTWLEVRRRRASPDDEPVAPLYTAAVRSDAGEPGGNAAGESPETASARPGHERAPASRPPAPVVPLARAPVLPAPPVPAPAPDDGLRAVERILRVAFARGASTVYVAADTAASMRVDGELLAVDGEAPLTSSSIRAWLSATGAAGRQAAVPQGAPIEWTYVVEHLGRVRCAGFVDRRGPGVIVTLPGRLMTADRLGLARPITSLVDEPDGLVLVTGPRGAGKRTLLTALVDLINRSRRCHVITLERALHVEHQPVNAFISQREVRGTDEERLSALSAALGEDPDVLIVDDLSTSRLFDLAVDAAARGCLVIGSLVAHTAVQALERAIALHSEERAPGARRSLAESLRAVVGQVLVPRIGGGRLAAREVLVNSPAAARLIAGGDLRSLQAALDAGDGTGMISLMHVLAAYVRNGLVEPAEALRRVDDRAQFTALLARRGVEVPRVERLV